MDDTVDELANTLAAALTAGSPVDVKGTLVPLRVRPSGPIAAASGVDLGTTIGMGGMGVVREGVQRSLERVVAVKTLRDELRGHTEPAAELLREARLTGTLEHPNVVPVHDVGVDEHGAPMIVLKRISGITWSALIRDADRVRELAPSGDLLEWNLRTLMQVASATHFAHSRGVIHRDLKPDNVMIGEFGETYVVDWGIAVPLEDLKEGATASSPAGTPCYMAPEMLGQDGAPPPSVATDVYLLGAVLFEIVSGHPPHDGTGLVDVLRKILTIDPEPPGDAPEELAAILRRAMHRDPAARHPSAEAFRRDVARFLEHRAAGELATEAERRLDQLRARLGAPAPDIDESVLLYNLFGAVRFGFRQALRGWPENPAAREGLRSAVEAMTRYELRCANPRAAAVLLDELDDAPDALVAAVEEAKRARIADEAEVARLRDLGRDLDPSVGRASRVALGLVLGAVWVAGPLTLGWVEARYPSFHTPWTVVGGSAGVALLVLLLAARGWDWIRRSALNRRLTAAILLALTLQSVMFVGLWLGGVDVAWSEAMMPLVWGCVLAMLSATVEPRLAPTAVVQLVAFLVAASHLPWRFGAMSVAMAATTINFVVIWRRPADGAKPPAPPTHPDRPTLAPEPPLRS